MIRPIEPALKPLLDGVHWKTVDSIIVKLGGTAASTIEVPSGFKTDFASVPRVFWRIIPRWGKYGLAAIIHDWLYRDQTRSRYLSDTIFLAAMRFLVVPGWQCLAIYWAVRAFGWTAWNFRKKRII